MRLQITTDVYVINPVIMVVKLECQRNSLGSQRVIASNGQEGDVPAVMNFRQFRPKFDKLNLC